MQGGKHKTWGSFASLEAAARAYDQAAVTAKGLVAEGTTNYDLSNYIDVQSAPPLLRRGPSLLAPPLCVPVDVTHIDVAFRSGVRARRACSERQKGRSSQKTAV